MWARLSIGKSSRRPAACRIRAGFQFCGHSRRGIGVSRSCAAAPGSGPLQAFANAIERGLEVHIVICGQLACGAGNDEAVTARTTSAAISA